MAYPRSQIVDAVNGGVYHCNSRCVRRAWLCGNDPLTGQSFEHRRQWIEDLILKLAICYAVRVYSYAIMSNHYHIIIEIRPQDVHLWSDEEVIDRWLRRRTYKSDKARERVRAALLTDPEKLQRAREYLGDLSRFMGELNENIARRANIEDGCTGRFWQGRFDSVPELDDTALLAAMAYVELNPVRAGIARLPEQAEYTAVARRLKAHPDNADPLVPLEELGLDLDRYIELLHWTAGLDPGGGSNDGPQHPAVATDHCVWTMLVGANKRYHRAYGPVERLRELAAAMGQQWLKGYRLREMKPA